MTIVEFLEARYDEIEAIAKAAKPAPWRREYHAAFMHNIMAADGNVLITDGLMGSPDVWHVLRHDPARVLADIAAKRKILDHHNPVDGECSVCTELVEEPYGRINGEPWGPLERRRHRQDWPCITVRLLVAIYSDHPDYQQDWRP